MKVKDIKGAYDYMDVYFEDGRVVRIDGEMIYHGFAAEENSITEWKVPKGEPISEEEKREIKEAVLEEANGLKIKIVFE